MGPLPRTDATWFRHWWCAVHSITFHRLVCTTLQLKFGSTDDCRFMDAEIGVRNLADTFRYNTLPSIIKALGLDSQIVDDGLDSFEDLPEYEQLSMLVSCRSPIRLVIATLPLTSIIVAGTAGAELRGPLVLPPGQSQHERFT